MGAGLPAIGLLAWRDAEKSIAGNQLPQNQHPQKPEDAGTLGLGSKLQAGQASFRASHLLSIFKAPAKKQSKIQTKAQTGRRFGISKSRTNTKTAALS